MTGGCGIPAEAEAIAGNLTATGSTSGGYILAQPAGTSGLEASTINFSGGRTRANNFNLGLSTAGQLGLTASTTVHAIVDANGYYAYAGAASQETWNLTLRDGDNRLATDYTVTPAGTTRKRNYFYFGHLLVATRDETGTVWRFYASDHLGTPRVVTSSTGSVLETHKYKAFGEEIGGSFGLQPLKFAAMERDAASGNDFDHARYLSSTLGRFLSPDKLQGKIRDPQSWNRYAYARNNPLRFFDPNGLEVRPVEVIMAGGQRQVSYVDTRFVPRLVEFNRLVTSKGFRLEFNDVFRTPEQQRGINTPFTKNTTGTSPHLAGLAVDVRLKTTEALPGLTTDARAAGLSPLRNQAADPVHFQANDLITRDERGKVDQSYRDLIQENQQQAREYEQLRILDPAAFARELVKVEPVQNCPQPGKDSPCAR